MQLKTVQIYEHEIIFMISCVFVVPIRLYINARVGLIIIILFKVILVKVTKYRKITLLKLK